MSLDFILNPDTDESKEPDHWRAIGLKSRSSAGSRRLVELSREPEDLTSFFCVVLEFIPNV